MVILCFDFRFSDFIFAFEAGWVKRAWGKAVGGEKECRGKAKVLPCPSVCRNKHVSQRLCIHQSTCLLILELLVFQINYKPPGGHWDYWKNCVSNAEWGSRVACFSNTPSFEWKSKITCCKLEKAACERKLLFLTHSKIIWKYTHSHACCILYSHEC